MIEPVMKHLEDGQALAREFGEKAEKGMVPKKAGKPPTGR